MHPELFWPILVVTPYSGHQMGYFPMVMENVKPGKRRTSRAVPPILKSVPSSEPTPENLALRLDGPELRELLHALQAMQAGDFSARMASDHVGTFGKLADCFNDI